MADVIDGVGGVVANVEGGIGDGAGGIVCNVWCFWCCC